jgi:hypothetical protein
MTCSPMCPCSLVAPSRVFNAVMDASLIAPSLRMLCPYNPPPSERQDQAHDSRTTNDGMHFLLF